METTDIREYFGIPVLIQLKTPIVIPVVTMKQKLPHAADPTTAQWVLEEAMEDFDKSIIPPPPPIFSSVPSLRYAVLYEVEGAGGDRVEVRWLIPGMVPGEHTIVATLVDGADIAFVTRVVSAVAPPAQSQILIAKA